MFTYRPMYSNLKLWGRGSEISESFVAQASIVLRICFTKKGLEKPVILNKVYLQMDKKKSYFGPV